MAYNPDNAYDESQDDYDEEEFEKQELSREERYKEDRRIKKDAIRDMESKMKPETVKRVNQEIRELKSNASAFVKRSRILWN